MRTEKDCVNLDLHYARSVLLRKELSSSLPMLQNATMSSW